MVVYPEVRYPHMAGLCRGKRYLGAGNGLSIDMPVNPQVIYALRCVNPMYTSLAFHDY